MEEIRRCYGAVLDEANRNSAFGSQLGRILRDIREAPPFVRDDFDLSEVYNRIRNTDRYSLDDATRAIQELDDWIAFAIRRNRFTIGIEIAEEDGNLEDELILEAEEIKRETREAYEQLRDTLDRYCRDNSN